MSSTRGRVGIVAALAVTGALIAGAPAQAATTCDNVGGGVLDVHITSDGGSAELQTLVTGEILVRDHGPIVACTGAAATRTNTDTILVTDDSDNGGTPAPADGMTSVSIFNPTSFVDPGGDEVGVILNLGAGTDSLFALGSPSRDYWALGNSGGLFGAPSINWNLSEGAPDSDMTLGGVDNLQLDPDDDIDVVVARGGVGTGAPYKQPGFLRIDGGAGDDALSGGDTPTGDLLDGGPGTDHLLGYDGTDRLVGGTGDDALDGGAAVDTLSFAPGTSGVNVDLAAGKVTGEGTDTVTGVENVDGTPGNDSLTGDAAANLLQGMNGADTFDGGPGADVLRGSVGADTVTYAKAPAGVTADLTAGAATGGYGADTLDQIDDLVGSSSADTLVGSATANRLDGGPGNDTVAALAGNDSVDVRDGGPDTASCGDGADTARADQASVDAVNADCETADFLPEAQQAAADGTEPGGARDTMLTFSLSGASSQRVLRQKGLVLKLQCPQEACSAIASAKARGVKLGPVTTRLQGGRAATVKLKLGGKAARKLRRTLRGRKPVRLAVTVLAIDTAANTQTKMLSVRARR